MTPDIIRKARDLTGYEWRPGMRWLAVMRHGGWESGLVVNEGDAYDLEAGENPMHPWRVDLVVPMISDPATADILREQGVSL